MKGLIVITAMIISVAAFGQKTDKEKPTTEFKRLLFGLNISPDICYRTLKNNDGSSSSSMTIDLRDKNEEPKFGYTAGLNLRYNFSKHLGIEAGVQYSNKGYASKKIELTFGDMIDPRYGFVYTNNGTAEPTKAKFLYNFNYLDLPVRAIFSFGEKRIHFVTSIGVTTNIFIKAIQTSVLEYENGDTKRETQNYPDEFKSLNISPTVSAGVDFRISNKLNMKVEPTFRYGLLKIIGTPITAYLWNGGLNITCYYGLK